MAGATAIVGSAAGLDSQTGAVTVTLPVVLMLLSALGGLAGGFLAALQNSAAGRAGGAIRRCPSV
jgi:acyl-coenzyme A thioesterase PaaI-like protein